MNTEDDSNTLHPWIAPELEARLTALVLGEASDFERDELERLVAERPELGLYRKRLEAMHSMLREVATGESAEEQGEWKFSGERRRAILAKLGLETVRNNDVVVISGSKRRLPWGMMVRIAACVAVIALVLGLMFPATTGALRKAQRPADGGMAIAYSDRGEKLNRQEGYFREGSKSEPEPRSAGDASLSGRYGVPLDGATKHQPAQKEWQRNPGDPSTKADADREAAELALADPASRPSVATGPAPPAEPMVVTRSGQVPALNGTVALGSGGDLLIRAAPEGGARISVGPVATDVDRDGVENFARVESEAKTKMASGVGGGRTARSMEDRPSDLVDISATSAFSVSNVEVPISDVSVEVGMDSKPSMTISGPESSGPGGGDWGKTPIAGTQSKESADLGGEISAGYMSDYVFEGDRAASAKGVDPSFAFEGANTYTGGTSISGGSALAMTNPESAAPYINKPDEGNANSQARIARDRAPAGNGDADRGHIPQDVVVRLQEHVKKSDEAALRGSQLMADGDYQGAIDQYRAALDLLPDAPLTEPRRRAYTKQFSRSSTVLANQRSEEGRYPEALAHVEEVLQPSVDPDNIDAKRLLERLNDPDHYSPALTPAHLERVRRVKLALKTAQGHLDLGDYDRADREFNKALNDDPYSTAARNGMEDTERHRMNYYDAGYDHTRARMLAEVTAGWESPVPASIDAVEFDGSSNLPQSPDRNEIARREEKLKSIIIPSVEFVDTPLKDALEFLQQRSIELDVQETDPSRKGIRIVADLGLLGGKEDGESAGPEEIAEENSGFGFGRSDGGGGDTRISLRLSNVPLAEAIRYTTALAQMKYKVEPDEVRVVPISSPDSDLLTNVYTVPPTFLSTGSAGASAAADPFADPVSAGGGSLQSRPNAKEILESAGITFPSGSSVVYNPETSQLIVRNTQDQRELVEAFVDSTSGGMDGAGIAGESPMAGGRPENSIQEILALTPQVGNGQTQEIDFRNLYASTGTGGAMRSSGGKVTSGTVSLEAIDENDKTKDHVIRRELAPDSPAAPPPSGTINFGAATSTIENSSGFFEVTDTSSLDPATKQRLKKMRYFEEGGSESNHLATEEVDKSVQDILALTPQVGKDIALESLRQADPQNVGEGSGAATPGLNLQTSTGGVAGAESAPSPGSEVDNEEGGIGLRLFTLGAAPVRLDYAFPLDSSSSPDQGGRFQFTMGATFGEEVAPTTEQPVTPPPLRQATPAALEETSPEAEPFSTFSLHVSDVSFQLAQSALASGQWPEAEKIRIEEFVNAFDYGDPMPGLNDRVACQVDQAIHPFLQQRNLLRIAMRTAEAGRAADTPLRLTVLLDNSGSMERPDRRDTVRRAFATLAAQLQGNDQITLISFARQPRLVADAYTGGQAGQLVELVSQLPSEGGTNLEAALQVAFEKAREHRSENSQNRIVLLTDGAANLGDAKAESLSAMVESMRESGIAFDAAGVGAEGLNDEILEALTRKGDGRYYLLDQPEDAEDGFAKQIAGALRPAAKNVKVQVEFNPMRVGSYRLLGFEKHRLETEDFRNDAVDAAEMAAAEAGVAVYQVEPKAGGEGDIGSVSVRFQDLDSGEMVEKRWPIPYLTGTLRPEQAGAAIQLATVASQFAAKLKGGPLGDVVDLGELARLAAALPDGPRVAELRTMIEQARAIEGAK